MGLGQRGGGSRQPLADSRQQEATDKNWAEDKELAKHRKEWLCHRVGGGSRQPLADSRQQEATDKNWAEDKELAKQRKEWLCHRVGGGREEVQEFKSGRVQESRDGIRD